MGEEKITTSIAYQLSNVYLFYEFMFNPKDLITAINNGPDAVKAKLVNDWRKIRTLNEENGRFLLLDQDRNISQTDFEITFNSSNKNIPVFFIIFPDSDLYMAESKCVALVLDNANPRYFTMEYFKSSLSGEKGFVFGEFVKEENDRKHLNYGTYMDVSIPNFASFVMEKIAQSDS